MEKKDRVIRYRQYWQQRLSGFNLSDNASGVGRTTKSEKSHLEYSFESSKRVAAQLNEVAKSASARHLTLVSTLAILLQKYNYVADCVIFTPFYNGEKGVVPFRVSDL